MISEKQKKILAFPYSKYDYLICDGAIRSGKTSLMMVAYVDWAMANYNGQQFIIMGNTVGSAKRNVVDPYIKMTYARKRYKLNYNRSTNELTVKRNGVENIFYVFGANNERAYEGIQGLTAAGCLIDEVALCNRKAFMTALGRLSVDGALSFFNCNPAYPLHWFNTEWILDAESRNALYLHFSMEDNPSLNEKTKNRLTNQYRGVFYDRYILGKWVVAEGLVYQFDSQDDYTCDHEEAIGNKRGIYYLSIDYGITNPFACLLWRVTQDRAYIVDEYYFADEKKKTDSELYEAVDRFAKGYNIEAIIIDPSASSFKQEIYRAGRYDAYDAKNAVVEGIRVTDQMLHDGAIKISKTCKNTIREMQLYRWDDSKAKDEVIKESDHAMDAMRYMANTVLKYELERYQ